VYLCTGLSENGIPINAFLIDPVKMMDVDCFRAPIVIPDTVDPELLHIAIWIGREHYASPIDYVEEVKRLGASRRIPENFDFSVLTPGKSRMMFIHPLAFTELIHEADCPVEGFHPNEGHGETVACLGAHWRYAKSLGSIVADGPVGTVGSVGQCLYPLEQSQIEVDPKDFSPGIFFQLPVTHIEYQANDRSDRGPDSTAERAAAAGFQYAIIDDE